MIPFQLNVNLSAIAKTVKGCVLLRRITKNYLLVMQSLPVVRSFKK